MPVAIFRVPLFVQPLKGGDAELVPPELLQGLNYQFVLVRDGGQEAIINLEASEETLTQVGEHQDCKILKPEEFKELYNSYPQPKLKQKYRLRSQPQAAVNLEAPDEQFEVDEQGNKSVDTIQTVRAGFYLIDVPVLGQP